MHIYDLEFGARPVPKYLQPSAEESLYFGEVTANNFRMRMEQNIDPIERNTLRPKAMMMFALRM